MRAPFFLFPFLLLALCGADAQSLRGRVIDQVSGEAIPYVNIGIPTHRTGTVSDESGRFELNLPPGADTVRVSAIGYETRDVSLGGTPDEIVIELRPRAYDLQTATVEATGLDRTRVIGVRTQSDKLVIQFLSNQLGTQIGRRLKIRKPSLLTEARLQIAESTFDTLSFRLNFYSMEGDRIADTPLNRENILIRSTIRSGSIAVDLRPYNLFAESDLLMAVEWVQTGEEWERGVDRVYFCAALFRGPNYFRFASQSGWEERKAPFDLGVSFCVEVKY